MRYIKTDSILGPDKIRRQITKIFEPATERTEDGWIATLPLGCTIGLAPSAEAALASVQAEMISAGWTPSENGMETRKWIVSSDAGDGINGKSFADLESAKTAVMAAMLPDGDWDEVPGEPDSPENAWEYFAYDKNSVSGPDARIEFAR